MTKQQLGLKVYTRKAMEGEPPKKHKRSGSFTEMPTIAEDPLQEGEEEIEVEQPQSPPATSGTVIETTVAPLPT